MATIPQEKNNRKRKYIELNNENNEKKAHLMKTSTFTQQDLSIQLKQY